LAKLGLEGNTVTRKQVANVLVDELAATSAKRTTKVPLDETDVEFDDDQIDEALSDVRDERIDGEEPRPSLGWRRLREDRLLDREERANLGARRRDRPREGAEEEEREARAEGEQKASRDHEHGHGRNGSPTPVPVGDERPKHGHERRSEDRRGEHETDLDRVETESCEVDRDDDGEVPVREGAEDARDEELLPVGREPGERRGGPLL